MIQSNDFPVSCCEDETESIKSSGKKMFPKDLKKTYVKRKPNKVDPMLEIRSKTQKMVREGRISLPYHQPKRRSLEEFLQRRKNTPSIPLKPIGALLNLVSERLSKQEEDVADFYKSESEDSAEENVNNIKYVNKSEDSQNQSEINIAAITAEEKLESENILRSSENVNNIDLCKDLEETNEIIVKMKSQDSVQLDKCCKLSNTYVDKENCSDSGIYSKNNGAFQQNVILNNSNNVNNMQVTENIIVQSKDTMKDNEMIQINEADQFISVNGNEKINDGITSAECGEFQDSENFQLQIQNSYVNEHVPDTIKVTNVEKKIDIRNKKLALLSQLKIPLETNVKLNEEPNSVLQFEVMSLPKSGVSKLMEKFAFHTAIKTKSPKKNTSKLSVIIAEKNSEGEIIGALKETLELTANQEIKDEFLSEKFSIPGSKYAYFKDKMKKTLILKKQANWDEYQKKKETLYTDDLSDDELEGIKEKLRGKPNFEPYHPEDELDDEDLILDDIDFKDKKKKKNYFLDEEAEVSHDEEENLNESEEDEFENEDDDVASDLSITESTEEAVQNTDVNNTEDLHTGTEEKNFYETSRGTKKIQNENESEENEFENESEENEFENENNDKDSNLSIIESREGIVQNADVNNTEDVHIVTKQKNYETDRNSKKIQNKYFRPIEISVNLDNDLKKPTKSNFSQLFKYNMNGNDLENKVLGLESIFTQKSNKETELTNSQVFDLCSGKFPSQIERSAAGIYASQFCSDSQNIEDSQEINLTLQDTNDECNYEIPDTLIENRNSLVLSDESDTEELFVRKKKSMKIKDSDDETDAAVEISEKAKEYDDDKSDLSQQLVKDDMNDVDVDDAHINDYSDESMEEIDYNSEEEIINIKEKTVNEFLEQEAELSESEWGSEDEVENDLDEFEKEAGDDDDIDQVKLKEELGKIHMRHILDDDQKDVRMLQEMLLEDGELHSDGKRERKFKWKNVDDNNFFSKTSNDSDDDQAADDENEQDENWRKIRHERETFISQQEKKHDLLENLVDDDSVSIPVAKNITVSAVMSNDKSSNFKYSLNNRFKCGSFLSRSKSILSRIAVTVNECKQNVKEVKNHRNFVFASISPEKELPDALSEKTKKRKIPNKSVTASKKLKSYSDTSVSVSKKGLLAQLASAD